MFKKFIVSVVIGTMSMSAFAAQDIYLTFKDGSEAVYKNLPDSIDNAQFAIILMQDYRKDFNTDIDHTKSRVVDHIPTDRSKSYAIPKQEPEVGFWDSTTGKVLKWTAGAVIVYAVIKALPLAGSVGCANPWDTAKDGSRCGLRSAASRPGGK